MPEPELVTRYLDRLREDFHVQREVLGTHFSGKRLRIDALVRPRDTSLWKNPDVAFGIEFKDTDRLDTNYDTKDYTKWLAQCVDYANTDWDDAGRIYIFSCPDLIGRVAKGAMDNGYFVQNFMSQLGVGELKEMGRYGLTFVLNTSHRMWSEKEGVAEGKHHGLERKYGSR